MLPPHFALDDDLEPPPSFQRASSIAGAHNSNKANSRRKNVNNGDVFWNTVQANEDGVSVPATTPTTASRAMTVGCAANVGSVAHDACKKDEASQAPSSSSMSSAAKHNVIANPHPNVKPQHPTHICSSSAAAAPASRSFFDPWNSSSTGHQRAENRLSGSTSWRESRNLKLGEQYRRGLGGGERVADTVGAGSTEFGKGGRKENGLWEKGAKGLREGGQKSLAEVWGKRKAGRRNTIAGEKSGKLDSGMGEWRLKPEPEFPVEDAEGIEDENPPDSNQTSVSIPLHRQIFDGLCFYLNGSTAPLVSDHKLKHLLAERGGKLSIALGRRSVTHVILGRASSAGGAGGGLAATKIQKEITRVGGKGVKFIGAEWVLECIKADRRLPETRFSTLKLAPKGQNSVYGLFYAAKSRGEGREGATKD